jgi:HEAT repeat protein
VAIELKQPLPLSADDQEVLPLALPVTEPVPTKAADANLGRSTTPERGCSGSASKARIRAWIWVGGGVASILALGIIAWASYFFLGSGGSLDNLDKVRAGMTEQEVQDLLGRGTVIDSKTVPGASKDSPARDIKRIQWKESRWSVTREVTIPFREGKAMMSFGPAALAEAKSTPPAAPPGPPAAIDPASLSAAEESVKTTRTSPPNTLDEALADLKGDQVRKLFGLQWLTRNQPDETRRVEVAHTLEPLLDGTDKLVRSSTAHVLVTWSTPEQVPTLVRLLEDAQSDVRGYAADALGSLKDERAIEPLAQRLLDRADRPRAARALIALGPVVDREAQKYLRNDDKSVREEAGRILKEIDRLTPDLELTQIVMRLKDRNARDRRDAANALTRADANNARRGEVAKALEPLLDDSDLGVRADGMRALALWATQENVPALIAALDKRDLKRPAMSALGKLKDERAVEPVAKHLLNLGDRAPASQALQAMGPLAEKEVVKYLQHADKGVRIEACRILQTVGTKTSLPALKTVWQFAIKQKQKDVAEASLKAVQGINSRP